MWLIHITHTDNKTGYYYMSLRGETYTTEVEQDAHSFNSSYEAQQFANRFIKEEYMLVRASQVP